MKREVGQGSSTSAHVLAAPVDGRVGWREFIGESSGEEGITLLEFSIGVAFGGDGGSGVRVDQDEPAPEGYAP